MANNVAMQPSADSEQEAASIGPIDPSTTVESAVQVHCETEPVSTSLLTEEHSHSSDAVQVN